MVYFNDVNGGWEFNEFWETLWETLGSEYHAVYLVYILVSHVILYVFVLDYLFTNPGL